MNYHDITTDDMLNGDGLRVVLWVSGCTHHCDGCQNPITWDIAGGLPFDENAENELFEKLNQPHIAGITFSGGDPLHPMNRDEVLMLAKKVRNLYPNKTIWLYTGFLWEDICTLDGIECIDVLADGRFEKDKLDNNLLWVGSPNQRVIDVKTSLQSGKAVLHKS